MEIKFDIRGNLKPYNKIKLSQSNFKEIFVDSFEKNSSRHHIFKKFSNYTKDFKKIVSKDFKLWIYGSFVTKKINPRDIDFLVLLNYDDYKIKSAIVKSQFIKNPCLKKYKLDAYLLVLYPKNHELYNQVGLDLVYWRDWFTKTRLNRNRKRHPKGYIELIFK